MNHQPQLKNEPNKRWKNYVRSFVTFISSVGGRTINKSACMTQNYTTKPVTQNVTGLI
jgi:hypothetical protein